MKRLAVPTAAALALVVAMWMWMAAPEAPSLATRTLADELPRAMVARPAIGAGAAATPARGRHGDAASAPARELATAAATNANAPAPLLLRGRVLLATGAPAPKARVRAGGDTTTADDDGRFTVRIADGHDIATAWLVGHEPVQRTDIAAFARDGRELEVVLPGPAATIDGVLVLPDGTPCKGWRLELGDGTLDSGDDALPKLSVEDFAAGLRADDAFLDTGLDSAGPRFRSPTANGNHNRIGDDGAFVVKGLRRGATYTLRAWHDKTLQDVRSDPIVAPTHGYRFVVREHAWRERIRGRVVDHAGGAIAGVKVRLTMRVHGNGGGESYETGQEVVTTADGTFAFSRTPLRDLLLRFDGGGTLGRYREFPASEPGEDLVVVLACHAAFRFEPIAGQPAPTALRALDANGRALWLQRDGGRGKGTSNTLPWPGTQPHATIHVSDAARWLVLEIDGVEVRRVPLRLLRGDVPLVRG